MIHRYLKGENDLNGKRVTLQDIAEAIVRYCEAGKMSDIPIEWFDEMHDYVHIAYIDKRVENGCT